jgi:hypothetical protein
VVETELVKFTGALAANRRIGAYIRWRGYGIASVGREGIDFGLGGGFRWMGHKYVQREEMAHVYPVQSRRLSLSTLAAAIIPQLSATGIRFVTQPGGVSGARDDYLFFSYRHEEWKLLDLVEELGYPVDRQPKTLRLLWKDEVRAAGLPTPVRRDRPRRSP